MYCFDLVRSLLTFFYNDLSFQNYFKLAKNCFFPRRLWQWDSFIAKIVLMYCLFIVWPLKRPLLSVRPVLESLYPLYGIHPVYTETTIDRQSDEHKVITSRVGRKDERGRRWRSPCGRSVTVAQVTWTADSQGQQLESQGTTGADQFQNGCWSR